MTSEFFAKSKWNQEKKLTDGFTSGLSGKQLAKVGVLVLKKEPQERKYDSIAYSLREDFVVTQIEPQDVLSGNLTTDNINIVVFPGGLCADFEIALGNEGREILCKYLFDGGSYYGVCAGAFYAGSCNYEGADESKKLLAVDLSFHPGLGQAKVKTTQEATQIFGCKENSEFSLYFSNGCLFEPMESHSFLGFEIPQPTVLATYSSLATNKMKIDYTKPETLEGSYGSMKEKEDTLQTIASPMFSHARHPNIKKMLTPAAAVCGSYGKGKVLSFGPHPEGSSDIGNMIKNCFLWLSGLPIEIE